MRLGTQGGAWLLGAALAMGCADEPAQEAVDEAAQTGREAGVRVDTVGVRSLAEGDTLNTESGLTVVETTVMFPPEAADGEAFAWEFYAEQLNPVKLIIVRYDQSREYFELVGESETVIPRQIGANRFVLREPIPLGFRYMYGIIQPKEPAIPFKKVYNWKAQITVRPFQRPLTRRDRFATYGWRYSARVLWRETQF